MGVMRVKKFKKSGKPPEAAAKGHQNKSTRRMRKIKISSGAYIAPSFWGVLAFFILPFLVVIYYSLVDNPISEE